MEAVRPEKRKQNDFEFDDGLPPAPFDKPYRWPGTGLDVQGD